MCISFVLMLGLCTVSYWFFDAMIKKEKKNPMRNNKSKNENESKKWDERNESKGDTNRDDFYLFIYFVIWCNRVIWMRHVSLEIIAIQLKWRAQNFLSVIPTFFSSWMRTKMRFLSTFCSCCFNCASICYIDMQRRHDWKRIAEKKIRKKRQWCTFHFYYCYSFYFKLLYKAK